MEAHERVAAQQRLWELSKSYRQPNRAKAEALGNLRAAKLKLERLIAHKRLAAPLRDPRDEARKMTADDITAWVRNLDDVQEAEDLVVWFEVVLSAVEDASWDRKNEMESLRSLLTDSREEARALGDRY